MTWPTVAIVTTNLDAAGDSPASARSDLLDAVTKQNQMIAHVSSFAATVLDDSSAANARATLGSTAVGDAVFIAASAAAARTTLEVAPRATRIDVASAATLDLTTAAPNTDDIRITGTTAITAVTVAAGRVLRVTASAAHTLTNNASIVTNTGANIVMAAGDTYQLRATAANTVEVLGVAAGAVLLTGNQTIAGVKTFSSQPVMPTQSMVRVDTPNGYGSTNLGIARFTNSTTQGSDITYADSATLGGSFTANAAGVYAISCSCQMNTANATTGVSLNTTQPTVSVGAISTAERVTYTQTYAATAHSFCSWTGYLAANDVLRIHNDGSGMGSFFQVTIVRLA